VSKTPRTTKIPRPVKKKNFLETHLPINKGAECEDVVLVGAMVRIPESTYIPQRMPMKQLKTDIKELLELELSMAQKKRIRKRSGGKQGRKGNRMTKIDELLFEHGFYIHQLQRVLSRSNNLWENSDKKGEEKEEF